MIEVDLQEQQQWQQGCAGNVSSGWHIQSTSNLYAVEVAGLCDTTVGGRTEYGCGYSYGSEGLVFVARNATWKLASSSDSQRNSRAGV